MDISYSNGTLTEAIVMAARASVIRKPRQDATKNGQRKCNHLRLKFIRDDNSRQQVGSIDFSPWPSMPVAFGVILGSDLRWQPSYISRQIEDISMNRKLSTFSCYPLTDTKPATSLSNYSRTKCVKSYTMARNVFLEIATGSLLLDAWARRHLPPITAEQISLRSASSSISRGRQLIRWVDHVSLA